MMNIWLAGSCEIKEAVFMSSGMSAHGEKKVCDNAAEQGFGPKCKCLFGHWAPSQTIGP